MGNKRAALSAFLFVNLFFIESSFADYVLSPSVSYMDQSLNDEQGQSFDAKLTLLDLRLGYLTDFGLYFGGLYSIHDQQLFESASDSYLGPSLGYFYEGFFLVGTYYLFGERDMTAGGVKFSKVQGFQLDLSYAIPITDTLHIGPQLTYHQVRFTEEQIIGVAQPADFRFEGLTPYFNLTLIFR